MSDTLPRSTKRLSLQSTLSWTLLLLVPASLLFAWLFRAINPFTFIKDVYSTTEIFALNLPLVFLVIAAALPILRHWRPKLFAALVRFLCSPIGLGVAAAALLLLCCLALSFSFFLSLLRTLSGAAILFAALGTGLRLLDSKLICLDQKRFESPLERLVLAGALGLGTFSLFVFIFGSFGLLNLWLWRIVIAALCVWHFNRIRALSTALLQAGEKRLNDGVSFAVAIAFFVALLLLAHAPTLWNLPADYDVLEYHLAAPAQYLRDGSVHFINENIYAAMPENGEMLYLLSMLLAGSKLDGLPGAHMILFAAWMLTVFCVYCLARRLERSLFDGTERSASPAPAVAALLFALIPMGSQLACDFHVEHFQALFHASALLCACAFISDFKIRQLFKGHAVNNAPAWLICSGLFAGLCCGTKYLALLFTLAPLGIFIFGYCAFVATLRDAVAASLRLALPAILVFAPWMIRNLLAAADPLFPLGTVMKRRLSGASGVPDRLDHFEAAHRAGDISGEAFLTTLRQLMPGLLPRPGKERPLALFFNRNDIELGPQTLLFAVPGFASIINAETALVAFVFLADLLLWFFFSLHNSRFLFPLLTALAALGGLGVARLWQIVPLRNPIIAFLAAMILVFTPLQLLWPWSTSSREGMAGAPMGEVALAQFFEQPPSALSGPLAIDSLPGSSNILFIGEAQTFYCTRTPAYSVVFNQSLLEEAIRKTETAKDAARLLRDRGITHLYIDYSEWLRLDTSYALTLSDTGGQWKLMQWETSPHVHAARETIKTFLGLREFKKYADAWPSQVFPAYLKLTPLEYERFDELMRTHTQVIWPREPRAIELRKLLD